MQSKEPNPSGPCRLDTQIHRRKKVKAFSPLLPEWEGTHEQRPEHLRMVDSRMVTRLPSEERKDD